MPGQIHVPISVAVQGLDKALKSLGGIGKIVKGAAAAFVTLAGSAKTANAAMATVEGAKVLERNLAGLETVFKNTTPQMVEFGKAASDIGLSMAEAAKATTFIGSVLKQSGFSIEETADLTERLVGLGADLALTYGYDVQEALLGMTALFRGEYDPIEKFGVAMKQSEIDAEKLARGLGHLTGAEERLADQQIRVEFLFDRAADAIGAVERQSSNLVVQQMRLRAEFENVRDTVATNLLPVFADFTSGLADITNNIAPRLRKVFDDMAEPMARVFHNLEPLLEGFINMVIDFVGMMVDLADVMTDPMTKLGGKIQEIIGLFGATLQTVTDLRFDGTTAFDALVVVLEGVATVLYTILDVLSQIIIYVSVFAGKLADAFNAASQAGDDTFFGFFDKANAFLNSIGPVITETNTLAGSLIEVRDGFVAAYVETAEFNRQLVRAKQSLRELGDQTEVWDVLSGNFDSTITGGDSSNSAGGTAKNYVADFFDGLESEVRKQQARIKLEGLGLTEGLIESILGSKGWEEVFNKVISGGKEALEEIQEAWANTKKGIDEATKAAEEFAKAQEEALKAAREEAQAYIDKMQALADKAQKAYTDADEKAQDFKKSIEQISQIDILPNAEEQLGRFELAVRRSMDTIRSELVSAFDEGIIFERDLQDLQAYVAAEEFELRRLAQVRDDLANRFTLSDALINEYRNALTGALSLTNLLSQVKSATETRMVTEVQQGVVKFGRSLKDFQVTVTRSYEETVEQVQSKSAGLVNNFRDMAEKARGFADNLRKLRAMGLDPMLFNQLIDAGVEAGGETAQALVDGGSDTINEINSLFKEIDAIGAELGEEVAASMYGSGIDMADGLLEGIRSKQEEMLELAMSMAQAFSDAFKSKLEIAVEKPVTQARKAAEAAQAAVPKMEDIDLEGIAKLQGYLDNATAALGKVTGAATIAGINTKIAAVEELKQILVEGGKLDISGIERGLTSAELVSRAEAAKSGSTVINNTINVTADSRTSGTKAGEAIVDKLQTFQFNNGSAAIVRLLD